MSAEGMDVTRQDGEGAKLYIPLEFPRAAKNDENTR